MQALREQGFIFQIWPNDHNPPHTHVFKAGTEVEIYLGDGTACPNVKKIKKMENRDVIKALPLTAENQQVLLEKWRSIHGNEQND